MMIIGRLVFPVREVFDILCLWIQRDAIALTVCCETFICYDSFNILTYQLINVYCIWLQDALQQEAAFLSGNVYTGFVFGEVASRCKGFAPVD